MKHEHLISDALHQSVEEAFSSTVMLSPVFTKINFDEKLEEGLILSIDTIGSLSGKLSICLSYKSAASIVSKMLGMDIEEGSSDASDGLGEIVNMVIGGIKNKIDGSGLTFDLSAPQTSELKDLVFDASGFVSVLECNYYIEDITFKVLFSYEVKDQEEKKDEGPSQAALDALALLGGLQATPDLAEENVSQAVSTPADDKTSQEESVEKKKEEPSQSALDALALLGGLEAASVEENPSEKEESVQEQSSPAEENVKKEVHTPSPDLQSAKDSLNKALAKFENIVKKSA